MFGGYATALLLLYQCEEKIWPEALAILDFLNILPVDFDTQGIEIDNVFKEFLERL
jgi:hypothetical protein